MTISRPAKMSYSSNTCSLTGVATRSRIFGSFFKKLATCIFVGSSLSFKFRWETENPAYFRTTDINPNPSGR